MEKKKKKKKKQDETGHFLTEYSVLEYPCLLLSLYRVSDVALLNSILI